MIRLNYYNYETDEWLTLDNPNVVQVVRCIKSRDPGFQSFHTLSAHADENSIETKMLGITRGMFDRFEVIYSYQGIAGWDYCVLVDNSYPDNGRPIPIVGDDGAHDVIPIRYTISIERTVEIARFFLAYETLPEGVATSPPMETS